MADQTESPTATIQDVATFFGVSERTVREWMQTRGIPYYRPTLGTVRFVMEEVKDWARNREPNSDGDVHAGS